MLCRIIALPTFFSNQCFEIKEFSLHWIKAYRFIDNWQDLLNLYNSPALRKYTYSLLTFILCSSIHFRVIFNYLWVLEKLFVKMKLLKSCATFCVNLLVKSQLKLIMSLKHLKRFGNYVLGRQIGKGGFGVVFKANHIKTGSTVAMKVIDLSKADPFVYKSTYREVYLLANLKSPNIVRIFEVASSKRFFCIFMEYIHGKQ